MSSTEISMFKAELLRIEMELDKYADLSRAELLTYCIKEKLNSTLRKYNEEMQGKMDVLSRAGNIRVLKAISKIQKNNDKKAIQDQIDSEKGELHDDE